MYHKQGRSTSVLVSTEKTSFLGSKFPTSPLAVVTSREPLRSGRARLAYMYSTKMCAVCRLEPRLGMRPPTQHFNTRGQHEEKRGERACRCRGCACHFACVGQCHMSYLRPYTNAQENVECSPILTRDSKSVLSSNRRLSCSWPLRPSRSSPPQDANTAWRSQRNPAL